MSYLEHCFHWFVDANSLHNLRDYVPDLVDRFINAYLEQNPKP